MVLFSAQLIDRRPAARGNTRPAGCLPSARGSQSTAMEIQDTLSEVLPAEAARQQREELARRHVDSAEAWLRRIVHHQLSQRYGTDFLRQEGLIKSGIRRHVISHREANPGKFLRDIDATTFDQLIDITTNPKLFEDHFGMPLTHAYPLGHEEARHFLIRVRDIRNDVSHGRGCSVRRLEQAICYSNDLIESLKIHFG